MLLPLADRLVFTGAASVLCFGALVTRRRYFLSLCFLAGACGVLGAEFTLEKFWAEAAVMAGLCLLFILVTGTLSLGRRRRSRLCRRKLSRKRGSPKSG